SLGVKQIRCSGQHLFLGWLPAEFAELRSVRVEIASQPDQMLLVRAAVFVITHQANHVRPFLRAEAAEAFAIERRTDDSATVLRHRSETGDALGHRHADDAAPLALHAHAMARQSRLAAPQERGD